MKLGTSIGTEKKQPVRVDGNTTRHEKLSEKFYFFFSSFLDDENRSRLSDSHSDLSIFASLFIELPVCVSLAVGMLWIYPLRLRLVAHVL